MADTQPLIWVHDDALGAEQPIFRQYPDAPAAYVFDDAVIDYRGYGIKRLGFISECLADLAVDTYRGDTVAALKALAADNGTKTIAMMATPCPALKEIARELTETLTVKQIPNTPLVLLTEEPDLKRFSRYWRQAQKSAFNSAELPLFKRPVP